MPNKATYEFAIIRLIPKVERGECLNVGVIVFSKPKRFLAIKTHIDETRIKAFSKEVDCQEITSYLEAWEAICDGKQTGGPIALLENPERFRWLTAARSTILQCSPVHPGLCENPEIVLEKLFEKYVLW